MLSASVKPGGCPIVQMKAGVRLACSRDLTRDCFADDQCHGGNVPSIINDSRVPDIFHHTIMWSLKAVNLIVIPNNLTKISRGKY